MKTIVNKARRPLKIALPGGKTLHLGLAGRGQVPDDALSRPAFRKLVDAGEIEVLGDQERAMLEDNDSTPLRRSSPAGHPARRSVGHKGDR